MCVWCVWVSLSSSTGHPPPEGSKKEPILIASYGFARLAHVASKHPGVFKREENRSRLRPHVVSVLSSAWSNLVFVLQSVSHRAAEFRERKPCNRKLAVGSSCGRLSAGLVAYQLCNPGRLLKLSEAVSHLVKKKKKSWGLSRIAKPPSRGFNKHKGISMSRRG